MKRNSSILFKQGSSGEKKTLIISFGGLHLVMGGTPPFEFLNTLTAIAPTCDQYFIVDRAQNWYHKGIKGYTINIPSTVSFLKEIIEDYEQVLFLGNSAGAYAALLFGSLLKVNTVLAFMPQTSLYDIDHKGFNPQYMDLRPYLNKVTNYEIYGREKVTTVNDPLHDPKHCTRLEGLQNVSVHIFNDLDLKEWRKNGELKKVILQQLNSF